MDFLLPSRKEVALQLQVSNYPGAQDKLGHRAVPLILPSSVR